MNAVDARLGALRLLMVTDGRGDGQRIVAAVRAAIAGGLRAVQVREPDLSARALAALCTALRELLAPLGGLVLVNDRADVAAAGVADGVQLGGRSLPLDAVRGMLPRPRLIGVSAHDPRELAVAAAGGADFALLSPVWPTTCKPDVAAIGAVRAAAWTAAAGLPVVWLGGVDAGRLDALGADVPGLIGFAARSALAEAGNAAAQARAMIAAAEAVRAGSLSGKR